MDPKACLDRAENALDANDLTEARDALADYWNWRNAGGFEPADGDARAEDLRQRRSARLWGPSR